MNPLNEKILPHFISRILVLLICVSVLTTYSAAQKLTDFNNLTSRQVSSLDAPQVTPIFVEGEPTCADLNNDNATFPSITSDFGLKITNLSSATYTFTNSSGSQLQGGAPSDPNNTLTTTINGNDVGFSSTKFIKAVIVQGTGTNANVYVYNPPTMSDPGPLNPPVNPNTGTFDLVRLTFCYGSSANVTIVKEVTLNGGGTASTTSFPFTASGLAASDFSLVDNNVIGPDRYTDSNITNFGNQITVTENPFGTGFRLLDIVCTGGMTSISLNDQTNGGTATITVQPSDFVVCTFKNEQNGTTAAGAVISGRVLTERGRGISRATVTVLDTHTLESRAVRTNAFGYFNMQEMPVGDFYIISVNSKGYWFANNNQGLTLTENLTNLQIIGTPFYFSNVNGQISDINPK
ncbi:MAG: carboxypeptidase-like regulatory domain-containing protein [Acidobacteriota bacterium]